jgi:uncharacterized protein YxjI
MARILSVSNKLLSLRGGIDIMDAQGMVAYRATGSFALFSPKWRIFQGDKEIASVRKRVFSFAPTWDFEGELGAITIRRKIFSFVRRYYTLGGPVDGAVVIGNLLDLRFKVSHAGVTLAKASGRVLTIRDRHEVEVLENPEQFVVFAMLVVQLDRRDERRRAAFDNE